MMSPGEAGFLLRPPGHFRHFAVRTGTVGKRRLLFHDKGRLLVEALYIVPANVEDLDSHLQPVAQRVDLGAMVVGPSNRDFGSVQFEFICQEEQLRVETPALDALMRKQRMRGRASERFESTLRVAVLHSQHDSQTEVEHPPVQLAMPRL